MKKIAVLIIAISVVSGISGYCLAAGRNHRSSSMEDNPALSGEIKDGVRVVQVKAFRYTYDPDPIVVKHGETVRLVVTATDVSHGLGIKDYGVNLKVPAHETESLEFLADKKGDFHIHCTVYCGPGHGNMHATLKVI